MRFTQALAGLGLLCAQALAGSTLNNLISRQLQPLPPSQDPFYQPPVGFQSTSPGSILRTRNVTNLLLAQGNLPIVLEALYQILYRSTDANGNPTASVTSVLVPPTANTSRHLAYSVAYDAADVDCATSYAVEAFSFSNTTAQFQTELLFIDSALLNGWVVTTSDYEGPQAAFTSGQAEAYGVLDSIRAVLKSGTLSPNAETTMLGYSGGAFATGWAAALKQSYAPELKIIGAAFGGLPANISSSIKLVNKTPNAGLFPASFNGLANAYSKFKTAIYNDLVPATADFFKRPLKECQQFLVGTGGYGADFSNQDIFTYFKSGAGILNNPDVASTINNSAVLANQATPTTIPSYIWQSSQDQITYRPDAEALAHQYCNTGGHVSFSGYTNGSHQYNGLNGAGRGFKFLADRFAGIPYKTCQFTNYNSSYNPDTQSVGYLAAPVAAEVLVLLTVLTATNS